jgi:AcrR family transcriptional regulator
LFVTNIIETALELVKQDGLEAVTLRNVAQRLDTGPASLYIYVANRDDLLQRLVDRAVPLSESCPDHTRVDPHLAIRSPLPRGRSR